MKNYCYSKTSGYHIFYKFVFKDALTNINESHYSSCAQNTLITIWLGMQFPVLAWLSEALFYPFVNPQQAGANKIMFYDCIVYDYLTATERVFKASFAVFARIILQVKSLFYDRVIKPEIYKVFKTGVMLEVVGSKPADLRGNLSQFFASLGVA